MKISIVIPTYNRPKELKRCLNSLLKQTLLPNEIIIVDDGNLKEIPEKNNLEVHGIKVIYRKKKENEKRGAAISRNIGIEYTSGDVIFFIDDDMILDNNYIKNIIDFYEKCRDTKLGGAGSLDVGIGKFNVIRLTEFLYNVIFLLSPIYPNSVTLSGFSDDISTKIVWRLYKKGIPMRAKWLGGGSCSFYKKVLEKYKFSEEFDREIYMGEDKFFTMNISREYNLYLIPDAKYINMKSEVMRPDKFKIGYNTIISAYRIYKNFVKKNNLHFLLFLYSCFGLLLKRFLIACVKMKKDEFLRLKGILKGVKDVSKKEFG